MTHTKHVNPNTTKTFCGRKLKEDCVLTFWFDVECKTCAKIAFKVSKTHAPYEDDKMKYYKVEVEQNYKKRCFNFDMKKILN